MNKVLSMLAVSAGIVALATSAPAATKYNAQGLSSGSHTQAATPSKPKVKYKVAYYYTRGFATDRSVNVSNFTHPSTGIYCILPSTSVDGDFPQISIEWDTSSGFGLWAFWKDTSDFSDCPSGYQEVTTYDLESGAAVLSDNVSFDATF